MAQLKKLILALITVIVVAIAISLLLLLLDLTGFEMTPVIMAIGYIFAGIAVGIGFYIAKQLFK